MTTHDSEQVVGRIPVYSYYDEIPQRVEPEPFEFNPWLEVAKILGMASLILAFWIGLGMWAWIIFANSRPWPQ